MYYSLWGVMGFLDRIKELIIVGGVMLLQESAFMFLVILIKNKMVYMLVAITEFIVSS